MTNGNGLPASGAALRAAMYVRSSTATYDSVERQVHECEKWATSNGVAIQTRIVDRACGDTLQSLGMSNLRQALATGDIDVVIVSAIDRFPRNWAAAQAFIQSELLARGVRCVFAASGIIRG